VRSAEAVELFIERSRTVRPSWDPTPAEEDAIAEIVRQLDGMPLAIELAAARMSLLSPSQLVQRLPRRFELLVGKKGVTDRQATLRGAIDWYQRGEKLMPPARIVDATRDYHTRHDGVGRFIAECCRRGAPVEREDRITLGKLHAAFVCWARDAGVSNVPLRDFSDAIRAHGLDASQKSGSARHLTTICLAPDSRSLLTGGDTNAAGGSS
jgi:hypothetical protein